MTDPLRPFERPLLDRMLAHNRWATAEILELCEKLPYGAWTRTFEIGPGSLYDTLLHVVGCMHRWADRIADRPLRPSLEAVAGEALTPAEIIDLLDAASRDLGDVCRSVMDEGRLEELMTIAIVRLPVFTVPREAAVLHVLTHTVHHLAQALNMLRQLSVPALPDLDVITFALACDPRASSDNG